MARLPERPYTYLTTIRGMCRDCRHVVPARVSLRDEQVWQEALCPDCPPTSPVLIAGDAAWYLAHANAPFADHAPLPGAHPPREGCPHDCGPCSWHTGPCQLPVVSITNDCDLRCPICFTYNRPDTRYYMSVDAMRETVDGVVRATGKVDLINITGGEPTRHPDLLKVLACCRRPEIGRVTMNSNGLRLARDPDLCRALADLGVHVVLSFHTFDAAVSVAMHGRDLVDEKLRALDNLARAGVKVTLLCVLARGLNENALDGLLGLLRRHESVLSLTIQTMTHTGQGGGDWPDRRPIPADEAARIVCAHSDGVLTFDDFQPRPAAHPLCYQTCTLLRDGETLLPLARLIDRDRLAALMSDSYLIRLDGERRLFRDAINEVYARGDAATLRHLKRLTERLFPADAEVDAFERQRRAESGVRTIYIHAHMDEDTFDCGRAMRCTDLVPVEPGRLVPACTYNLFYRQQDPRFFEPPKGSAP